MCWSGEASALLATAGLCSTAYVAYKKEDKHLWMPLGYFSLMELLQAVTYHYIDSCGAPINQVLTLLGYLHITFQPFFINMFAMHFLPKHVKEKIQDWVYAICFVGSILMLIKLYPFEWGGMCPIGKEALCESNLCSVHGNWHIAWNIPLNSLAYLKWGYAFPGMILPFVYGSWRLGLYLYLLGPFMAGFFTDNLNEWPAVWCLLSIGLLLVVIKTPIRKYLYIKKKWYFWKFPRKKY